MKIVQGFVSIPSLSDNAVNAIAEFGEFSPHSATFTKDLRSYSDTNVYPHIEIITVKVIDESSTEIVLPTAVSNTMLAVSNLIYTQYTNSAIPLNMNKATMEQAIRKRRSNQCLCAHCTCRLAKYRNSVTISME